MKKQYCACGNPQSHPVPHSHSFNNTMFSFRAYDSKSNIMWYWDLQDMSCNDIGELKGGYYCGINDLSIILKNYQIMLFTGFKDKNKKDIFDGDILTATERNQGKKEGYLRKEIVYLFPGGFKVFGRPMVEFRTQDDNKTIKNCMWRTSNSSHDFIYLELVNFEVIGNIYENPELLK